VGLSRLLRDDSDPGNHLQTPVTLRFLTLLTAPPPWALAVALGSASLAGAAFAAWEPGRVALFTLLASLLRTKDVEDKETRGMIRGYLAANPGGTYMDLKRNLRLNNGTLAWHLMKLEKEGLIKSQIRGARKCYFPSEVPLSLEDGIELPDIQRRILTVVVRDPGVPVSLLSEELNVSHQLALYHLRRLAQKGLVVLGRQTVRLRAYPRERREA